MFKKLKPAFRGWTHPGPLPPAGAAPEEGETLDHIAGHWCIFQYRKGHRFSTDDVLCAWYASQWAPRVENYCDLGSGIGSVALFVAWRLPGAKIVTLEAQEISHRLQKKSIEYNGQRERFTPLLGDLREHGLLLEKAPFDLVTGTPPYWDEKDALPAAPAQAVPARLEMRGTVADYAKAAAAVLAPGGVFATVFPDVQDERVRAALSDAHLKLLRTRAVCFKENVDSKKSGLRLYLAGRMQDYPEKYQTFEENPLVIRDEKGAISAEYSAVKLSFGFPPG